MKLLTKMIMELESVDGLNAKKTIIQRFLPEKEIQEALKFAMDPFIRFGITSKTVEEAPGDGKQSMEWPNVSKVLSRLASREITGNAAVEAIEQLVLYSAAEHREILGRILDKHLNVGVGTTIINKLHKGLIPTFEVQRCETYEGDQNEMPLPFGVTYASKKLDGLRTIAIKLKKDTSFRFFSREGHEFTSLEVLRRALDQKFMFIDELVLDGEGCVLDEDGSENFPAALSQFRRKDIQVEKPYFYIFDAIHPDSFSARLGTDPFVKRLEFMREHVGKGSCFEVLEQTRIPSPDFLVTMRDLAEAKGWEGLILRDGEAPYVGKKSEHLLKVKKFYDHEFQVVGSYEGEGEFEGALGGLHVQGEVDGKHVVTSVGSGFKAHERRELWKDRDSLVSQVVTVKYFEVTKAKNALTHSLRFPIFKCFHGKERTT